MAETITKLPIKTDPKAPVPATQSGQSWAPLESLRREIDRIFDSFHRGSLAFPFSQRAFEFELPSLRGMV
ncbi:MAG: Hsp20/alpha crystallin family protein, partial [Hyphomicrobiales bacterium]